MMNSSDEEEDDFDSEVAQSNRLILNPASNVCPRCREKFDCAYVGKVEIWACPFCHPSLFDQ